MTPAFYVIAAVAVLVSMYVVLRKPVREYVAMRGRRVVTCPENQQPAAVRVDAVHAAISATRGFQDLHLEQCSRWPEKAGCGEECLRQIEASPADCLVKSQLTRWYADKSCALCGKPLGAIDWTQHQPAVMAPDSRTMEWSDIAPETLPQVLASHAAICWDCHAAESFRRQRPDLVIDNPFH
jgi:hypothetical protein